MPNLVSNPIYRMIQEVERSAKGSQPRLDDKALAYELEAVQDWRELAGLASAWRDIGWGNVITYSRKVFIPLTHLCRDVCHYCTFAKAPRVIGQAFLTVDQALDIARAGAAVGCREALFTLGDRPEARYAAARDALQQLGHATTADYVAEVAQRVRAETGLLPHFNMGVLSAAEYQMLRPHAPSFGLMLETASERLSERGGPHYGSPDKHPAARLETLRLAGEAHIPITSGILIGIGETRRERLESLFALRDLHDRYGHVQEVIIQNFRAKPGTKMVNAPEPSMDELCWTTAVARLILGSAMSIQVPPNLFDGDLTDLIRAGINDWGGVSPVTPDHVNPEAPWPHLDRLSEDTDRGGKTLTERITVYPAYIEERDRWIDPGLHADVLRHSDCSGLATSDIWKAGSTTIGDIACLAVTPTASQVDRVGSQTIDIVEKCVAGERLEEAELVHLFNARGHDFTHVTHTADRLRRQTKGDTITYVVNRNINYTNVCQYHCNFCAFSRGPIQEDLREKPYIVDLNEIRRRVKEAWDRGATEVCLQGGIHPDYTGRTYLDICEAAKTECPDMHIHAFSPLEVLHGATTLGTSISAFLSDLKSAGLSTLPGTAAEILDDEVRRQICPDKLNTQEWLTVVRSAHELGLRTTCTIMFGHVESYKHWARHILRLAELQRDTGGLTEFVPLPFVHEEAPLFKKKGARQGPTLREAILMHAVGRLAFHGLIDNIQTSWVKMGEHGAQLCLQAGANDLGGTLMNESISRAAGAAHGQEMPPAAMEALAARLGRNAMQRTPLYRNVSPERQQASHAAPALVPVRFTKAGRLVRGHGHQVLSEAEQ
ncbi:5-amino-6-(D-ribitylamino)uracil--L-tyrosine 4-hydroxyphenyl transferase CofH [Mycetohabitans rhizoxinica]|uniref:5-amino-6-(D-ribitylamino)uracil--L-tyrosine 4-hydroxyphenyl transferase CofH n=1 Tax=Mycetohabitans rhizoxinica TaxID=412963 RepID=UPI0030CAEA38